MSASLLDSGSDATSQMLETSLPEIDTAQQLKGLRSTLKKSALLCLVFGLVISLMQLSLPIFSMQIFDRVLPSSHIPTLLALTVIVVLVTCCSAAIDGCRSLVLSRSGQRLNQTLSQYAETVKVSTRESKTLLSDLDFLRNFLSGPTITSLLDTPWTGIYLLALFLMSPYIGCYAVASFVALVLIALLGQHLTLLPERDVRRLEAHTADMMIANHGSRSTLVALGVLPALIGRLSAARLQNHLAFDKLSRRKVWLDASLRGLRSLLQVGILGLTAALCVYQEVNPGAIVASALIFTRAVTPVERLMSGLPSIRTAWLTWHRLQASFDLASRTPQSLSFPSIKGFVKLAGVSVPSPTKPRMAIDNISLEIKPGTLSVIVGPEGSGKSALVKLLCGVLAPHRGTVMLDGMEFRNYRSEELAGQIGYLPQMTMLRTETFAQLISRGDEIDTEAMIEASRQAGIEQLIRSLPNGYQTVLETDPPNLSGGQMRQVALASALYGNPRLVILDEPMAGLDDAAEMDVTGTIQQLVNSGSAVVVVSRCVHLLPITSQLFLLEQGRLKLTADPAAIRRLAGPRDVTT